MRPFSEIRLTLDSALVDGGGTSRMLAMRSGWSISATRTALDNMVRAGDACKPRCVRVPGVKRPVPWYERALPAVGLAAGAGPAQPHMSLIAAWAMPGCRAAPPRATPATVAAGAAM